MLLYVPTTVGYIFLNNPHVTSCNASYVIHTKNKCPICTSVTTELPKKETTSWCPSLVRQCLKLIVSLPQRTTTTAQHALKNTGPFQDRQQASYPSTAKVSRRKKKCSLLKIVGQTVVLPYVYRESKPCIMCGPATC